MPWVAAVFNPQPTHETTRRRRVWEARYLSGLMTLPELGAQLRRECQQVGLEQADVVIGLTDGGAGLENCLLEAVRGMTGEIVFILDFYHASEHLLEFAKVLHPHDEDIRKQRVQGWCHRLKHSGGRALFDELQSLDLTRAGPAVVSAHQNLLGYLRNNLHRMDWTFLIRWMPRCWSFGSSSRDAVCSMNWFAPEPNGCCRQRLKPKWTSSSPNNPIGAMSRDVEGKPFQDGLLQDAA